MKIERIDEKTVKCFLSNEELKQYNLNYKDFVMRSEKAKEVMQEIIEQAEEEVGYRPPQPIFDLQIMVVPEQGLVLILSEKEPSEINDGELFLQYLKEMKQILQQTKEKLNLSQEMNAVNNMISENEKQEQLPIKEKRRRISKKIKNPDFVMFIFSSIGNIMDFATVLPKNLRVRSEVYKMEHYYLLYLHKGTASYERYSKVCVQAMEFAGVYTAMEDRIEYIKEHGECLIAEKALKKLRLDA